MANYRELSPEDADLLVSCGATVEYTHLDDPIDDDYSWGVYAYHKWAPSDYYNRPPVGGVRFRVLMESTDE